ncbi:MAG: acyl-CoA-binding protein [Sphingobacteriales bacterium]|nr:acyl-CoA-binding protein [Sphingobacteriales bacterium]
MGITELFEQALANSKTITERPSNEILLKLYSLYKQATEGDINVDPPSNPFDIVNKAKFNAWNELKGNTKEESMQEYIDLVNKLKEE